MSPALKRHEIPVSHSVQHALDTRLNPWIDNPPQFGEGDIRKGGFKREQLLDMRHRLQPLKERFGDSVQDLVRVALQFALAQSENACVIPGFKNAAQVESNASAAGKPLTAGDVEFVKKALSGP